MPIIKPETTIKTVKRLLAQFEEQVLKANRSNPDVASRVWLVLTGLRGPDNKDSMLKSATTEILRRYIIDKLALKANAFRSYDDIERVEIRKRLNSEKDHFGFHAIAAFEAVGLKWDELNKPEEVHATKKKSVDKGRKDKKAVL